MYAVTSGIMAHLSLAELIPKAVKLDPEDRLASKCIFAGLALMMLSVVLFEVG